jgi:hypothetical protein
MRKERRLTVFENRMLRRISGTKRDGVEGYRWNDNIKMNFKEVGCENVNWIHMAQDRVHWQAS